MTYSNATFDPCSIFPARVGTRPTKASPMKEGGIRKGTSNPATGEVYIPLGNNAYDRTIRRHEAGHAIYSPTTMTTADKTYLGQGLEDARLHAVCLPGTDVPMSVREDELEACLEDLKQCQSPEAIPNPNIDALVALRARAMLDATQEHLNTTLAFKEWRKLCAKVAPAYANAVERAIEKLKLGDKEAAGTELKPYFKDEMPPSDMSLWPGAGKDDGDGKTDPSDIPTEEQVFDKVDGKLTTMAASMMSEAAIKELRRTKVPTMHIRNLQAVDNIPTIFGDTRKHVASGAKIRAKKLVLTISPSTPKIFLKEIKYQGGSILIDASGSMSIDADKLQKLLNSAPMATIGFYNAPTDGSDFGNLWIYSTKGKRALDLSHVNIEGRLNPKTKAYYTDKKGDLQLKITFPDDYFGWGNIVDLQAMQWLLAQDAPRYFLTDGGFTGPCSSIAHDLLGNALARKKFIQVLSLSAMYEILSKKKAR